MKKPHLKHEKFFWERGATVVAGVDEAGRGCLAGPVVVAAVSFAPQTIQEPLIKDSKLLSPDQRKEAYDYIIEEASYWQIVEGSVQEIDTYNILGATLRGMSKVVKRIPNLHAVLVDGNATPNTHLVEEMVQTIIHGDQISYSIAAASILAKVHRDRVMQKLHEEFEEYDWWNNKGYGTLKHREALVSHGPTKHHRSVFVKTVLEKQLNLID